MILQVHRERLKPGREAAYRAIEEDTARAYARLGCPHPHMALEALTGPGEVWWLNTFESDVERQQVTEAYERNPALMAALEENSKLKARETGAAAEVFLSYRRISATASMAARRRALRRRDRDQREEPAAGAIFEAPDGVRFSFDRSRHATKRNS